MTGTATETAVVGEKLSKVFKDFWGRNKVKALSDVDMAIPRGSIFGLLGPNGAGKSTLIKLILGHLYPTTGRLAIFGKPPRDVAVKQYMGYLPERSFFYKHLTAAEILNYFGMILNLSGEQIASRTGQLLEMVGLEAARDRMAGEFSHGMGRRLGLAQALLNDPDLLILDEPTAGLDPVGCREVKDLIITLGKRGKTVLLTSHLLSDVEDVCDEIMLLYGGQVQTHGKVGELLRDRNRLRLEFPVVSDQTLESARAALAVEISPDDIVADSPIEELESYFLKMVAQRERQQHDTAGARMGRGVAAYLRDDQYADHRLVDTGVLDALSREQPVEAPSSNASPEPQIDAAALTDLTEPEAVDSGDDDDDDDDNDKVDTNLLDDLTK